MKGNIRNQFFLKEKKGKKFVIYDLNLFFLCRLLCTLIVFKEKKKKILN
jgi:hypothetical protein